MLQQVKRVLYATDLSPNAAHAFLYAASFAQTQGSEIIILHVIEKLPDMAQALVGTALTEEKTQKAYEHAMSHVKERLEKFCDTVAKDYPECREKVIAIDVVRGYPVDEILKKRQEYDCDLIILGSHGKGIISHALMGSVTERVLRRARLPVMVIPLPEGKADITVQ